MTCFTFSSSHFFGVVGLAGLVGLGRIVGLSSLGRFAGFRSLVVAAFKTIADHTT